MKLYKNDRGVTLIELLVVIVLIGSIVIIIWNFLFYLLNFNERSILKNQLQQEANLIVNTIQSLHTKNEIQTITFDHSNNSNIIIEYKKFNPLTNSFDSNKIQESFNRQDIKYTLISGEISAPVRDINFYLKLVSRKNENITYEIKTSFSKLE